MKLSKIALTVFLLLLFLPGRVAADPTAGDHAYFFPLVSKVIAAARLGPFLGSVMVMAADPLNPGVLYAGTWGSGIYKSTDRGATWAPVNAGLANLLIQALAVDQKNSAYVYAGTYYDSTVYSGVYRSKNGGQVWQAGGPMINVYNGVTVARPVVYALAADPLNGGVVYAGTRMKDLVPGQIVYGGGGVFKSPDHGATWLTANTGLPPDDLYVYDLAINPKNSSQVYAAMHESGAYATDNAGAQWRNLSAPENSGRVIAVDPFNPQTLFFGAWYGGTGLFRSENRGAAWHGSGLGGLRMSSLAVDPTNSNYVYATTSDSIVGIPAGLYASSDNGSSWSPSSLNPSITKALVDPFDGATVYAGTVQSGLLRSLDHGATWNYSNWGLSGFSVTGMAVNPVSPALIYAALNQWGVMKSFDRGVSWQQASAGLPDLANLTGLVMDPADPQVLYAATSDAGVYVSRDGAASWALVAAGYPAVIAIQTAPGQAGVPSGSSQPELNDPLHNRPAPPVQQRDQDGLQNNLQAAGSVASAASVSGLSLAVSPKASRAVLVGTLGKGISRLLGASWAATSLSTGNVYTLMYDLAGRAFAGVDAGSGSLLVSSNDGQNWTASAVGLSGRTVYAISQSKLLNNLYYAGTDSGLYRSEDGGATWSAAGLTGQAVTALQADLNDANTVIAGTPAALYASRDKGASWQAIESSLDNFGIQKILPDPADKYFLYLATRFGGVVRIAR